jgi:hypothetical protein
MSGRPAADEKGVDVAMLEAIGIAVNAVLAVLAFLSRAGR